MPTKSLKSNKRDKWTHIIYKQSKQETAIREIDSKCSSDPEKGKDN